MSRQLTLEDARVTVTYNGCSRTFNLQGSELTETTRDDGSVYRYLCKDSRDFIAASVELALLQIVEES